MPMSPAGRDRRVAARAPQRGEEQAVADLRPGQLGGGAPEDRAARAWRGMVAGRAAGARHTARDAGHRRAHAVGRRDHRAAARRVRRARRSSPPARTRRSRAGPRCPSPYTREDAERFLAIAATEARAGVGVALAVAGRDDRADRHGRPVRARRASRATARSATGPPRRPAAAAPPARAVVLLRDWAAATLGPARDRDPRPSRQRAVAARRERARASPAPASCAGTAVAPDHLLVFVWRAAASSG